MRSRSSAVNLPSRRTNSVWRRRGFFGCISCQMGFPGSDRLCSAVFLRCDAWPWQDSQTDSLSPRTVQFIEQGAVHASFDRAHQEKGEPARSVVARGVADLRGRPYRQDRPKIGGRVSRLAGHIRGFASPAPDRQANRRGGRRLAGNRQPHPQAPWPVGASA
jgi:hypothetical protein